MLVTHFRFEPALQSGADSERRTADWWLVQEDAWSIRWIIDPRHHDGAWP